MLVALAAQPASWDAACAHAVMATVHSDARFMPEHLQVVEVAGQYAGLLLLIDRQVRFGSVLLRCAILVPSYAEGTDNGAVPAAMREMLRRVAGQGFHLAMRWAPAVSGMEQGFGPGQKTYAVVLPASALPFGDTGYRVRAATTADATALSACYHASTATTTLAEMRSDEPWQWRAAGERQQVDVAADPLGEVRGYVRVVHGDGTLWAPEIAVLDDGPAQALFDHLLRSAAGREICVAATPEQRWSRWAFAHGASLVVEPGAGYGAIRVLNMRTFLEATLPELERRLQLSEFTGRSGRLRLETPLGSIGLVAEDGRLLLDEGRDAPLVTLPWSALSALVIGYRGVEESASQPGVRIEGARTQRLLQVLFPEAFACWSPPACF